MVSDFIDDLLVSYDNDPTFCEKYPGTWITDAVYQRNYIELAILLSELLPVLENETFTFNEDFDGENVFEEFVFSILFQLFHKQIIISQKENVGKIDTSKLKELLSLVTSGNELKNNPAS